MRAVRIESTGLIKHSRTNSPLLSIKTDSIYSHSWHVKSFHLVHFANSLLQLVGMGTNDSRNLNAVLVEEKRWNSFELFDAFLNLRRFVKVNLKEYFRIFFFSIHSENQQTLKKSILSPCVEANLSKRGLICTHGPQHGAHMSIATTRSPLEATFALSSACENR